MSLKGKSIFTGSIALILFAMLRNFIPISNMLFFVIMCAVFVAVMLAAYIGLQKGKQYDSPTVCKVWAVLPVIAFVVWLVLFYVNETNAESALKEEEVVRHSLPFLLWFGLMIAGVGICLFILRKGPSDKAGAVKKGIRGAVAVLFAAAVGVLFYAPNVFLDVQGGTYHSHAYINSILNACWLIPYSEDMQSLYGHYGILFMPVLKVLHKFGAVDYLTGLFVVCAVLAGISVLLFAYILNYFAKRELFYYLGLLAIGEQYFMLMQGGVYLQVHPHRMLFPVLLTAFALFEQKRRKQYPVIAIGILTFSFVWSTEVGIVTMLAFALYRWVEKVWDGTPLQMRKVLRLLPEILVYAGIPFVLSYGIISGYNLLAGGTVLDLEEFLFPLISDRDYINNIELPLPDVTHAWIGSSILFLSVASFAIFKVVFGEAQKEEVPNGEKEKMTFAFLVGVMCLGLMLYYINRPVEGCMFIVLFLMLVLQVMIAEKCQEIYEEQKESRESVFLKDGRAFMLSLRVITVLILVVMTFDSMYSMPKAFRAAQETVWKKEELKEFAEYVYVQIPPDAVAFGEGVPEIMALIDRDTHLHTTEWSYRNMPLDTMERIRYQLEGQQWIFCNMASLHEMQSYYPGLSDQYVLHEVMTYGEAEFGFFRKP